MNLDSISEEEIYKILKKRQYLFISTISFEERCTNICQKLIENNLDPRRSILYDYLTDVDPTDLGNKLHNEHIKIFFDLLKEKENVLVTKKINPYSTSVLRDNFSNILKFDFNQIVIDISCMTRAHILSLASILTCSPNENREIYFSYTAAESYNIESECESGWIDILLLPVGFPKSLRREGHARGIVLAGHDAERLSLALSELEPAAGCMIYSNTYERPDLMYHAKEVNMYLCKHLLSLRMPHKSYEVDSPSYSWKEEHIMLDDYDSLEKIITEQVKFAGEDEGPVVLYPFGPKTLVFSAGLILSSLKNINSWAIYPVPYRYDIDYSQRSARTYWMKTQ